MEAKQGAAIEIENISKSYHIVKSENETPQGVFWALNNVSLNINKGDVVSIIGNNGSGKTTLLKILSQITKPTSGQVRFYGTVTSILEIGTNFHPDLSGKENVMMQMQLSKIPLEKNSSYLQEISDFSEIGNFFDQPVKYYSSGMFLRLAFSLAFHLASDILILDEVLSVGDEGFRLKCQQLMKQFTQKGKTILFVSHNRLEILEWSNKCIWLEKGNVRRIGDSSVILSEYFSMHRDNFDMRNMVIDISSNQSAFNSVNDGTIKLKWDRDNAPGNDLVSIHELSVSSLTSNTLYISDPIQIRFLIQKKVEGIKIGAAFFLQDIFYQPVFAGHFLNNNSKEDYTEKFKNETGLIEVLCVIPPNFLAPGKYFFLVRFGVEEGAWNTRSPEAFRFSEQMNFTIHPDAGYIDFIGDASKGSVRPKLDWIMRKI